MKLSLRTPPAVCLAPALLLLAPLADEVAFKPRDGSSVGKTMTMEAELTVTALAAVLNGEPVPGEALDEVRGQALLINWVVGVTEKYVASKDGRPTDLHRTFDKLSLRSEFGEESKSRDDFSVLEGKTVRFVWNEESQEYDKRYFESQGDDQHLEGLLDDMDVRPLLPGKKVSAGDTWTVAAERLVPVFFPGGMIGGGKDDAEELADLQKRIEEQFLAATRDFKVTCTYKGAREDAGVRVGEIAFRYDGKARLDLGSLIEDIARREGRGEMPEFSVSATLSLGLSGEGTLLWDLAGGCLHHYQLESDLVLEAEMSVDIDMQGQSMEMSLNGKAEGQVGLELKRSDG